MLGLWKKKWAKKDTGEKFMPNIMLKERVPLCKKLQLALTNGYEWSLVNLVHSNRSTMNNSHALISSCPSSSFYPVLSCVHTRANVKSNHEWNVIHHIRRCSAQIMIKTSCILSIVETTSRDSFHLRQTKHITTNVVSLINNALPFISDGLEK